MKKFGCMQFAVVFVLICVVLIGALIFAVNKMLDNVLADKVLSQLPKYLNSQIFETDDSADYINYSKYFFGDNAIDSLEGHEYMKKVTEEDMSEIISHIENYEEWVKAKGYEGYDFNRGVITPDDYFYIENKETFDGYSGLPDKFSAYTLYLFDTQTKTLYYMHYNM